MSEKHQGITQHDTVTDQNQSVTRPPLYHVVLLNDDYTSMEFVLKVVQQVFHRSSQEAMEIMLEVHKKGKGIAGTYTRDIAKTKAEKVMHLAFRENFPLKCILEKV